MILAIIIIAAVIIAFVAIQIKVTKITSEDDDYYDGMC